MNKIEILDLLGNSIHILNAQSAFLQINIKDQPSGIYFLKINFTNNSSIIKRIICN